MANLLEKASIILTPTAYNNGEALCVKPSDGSGDFDFSRNSAATRVNAQGLVENVQILSSNLVQNGDFSEEGAEEVSNGSFTNGSTDWTFGAAWSVGEDKAIYDNSASSVLNQSFTWEVGKTYKITFDIGDFTTSQRFDIYSGVSFIKTAIVESDTSYTIYFNGDSGNAFRFRGFTRESFSITNISVKEVGQNWDLLNGTITDKYNASLTSYQNGIRVNPFTYTGTVKVTFDLVVTSGSCKFVAGGSNEQIYSTSGTKEIIVTNPSRFEFNAFNLGWVGTLDNVSAIQITDDTNLPRINYEGFIYQDALGSEEIVNGGFDDGENNWDFSGDWTLVNGTAEILTSTNSFLVQSNVVDLSVKNYKLQYEVITTNGSNFRLAGGNSAFGTITLDSATVGVKTIYLTSNGTARNLQFNQNAFRGSIDNVSVKEYLGQEVVPDSGCGSWLFEPQSTNLIPYSETFSDSFYVKDSGVVVGAKNNISPSGNANATKIDVTNNGRIYANIATNTYYTSVFIKSGTFSHFKFAGSNVDLIAETNANGSIQKFGNGWYRISLSYTGNRPFQIQAYPDGTYSSHTTSGNYYIWGAQAETLLFTSSYIPATEGSTVTRNQDLCTNGATGAGLINSTEGVLYAEIAALADGVGTRTISVSDGTNNNSITLRYTTNAGIVNAFIVAGGFIQFSANISGVSVLDFNKVAIKYSLNNMALWINGVEVATDTSGTMPLGLNEINFTRGDGANKFFGKTKALAVWKEALSDSELQSLTTI